MKCTKCEHGTCIKVTTQNPGSDRGHRGLLLWIFFFPVMLALFAWRYLIKGGRRQEFHKETHWRCNYCAHIHRPELDADAPSTSMAVAEANAITPETDASDGDE